MLATKGQNEQFQKLLDCAPELQAAMRFSVKAELVADDAPLVPGTKLVHFIRHGDGAHNAAQREWRQRPDWDGNSEPYTEDNDPDFKYLDPELNELGKNQAAALQSRSALVKPKLMVVSALKRATQTGIIAFQEHFDSGLKTVALEEIHCTWRTCDKRCDLSELQEMFPKVDYSHIQFEKDIEWKGGSERNWKSLGMRAVRFCTWLKARDEDHIVVATHSAFLLALCNAVLTLPPDERAWFENAEMRTMRLTFQDKRPPNPQEGAKP
jgi:broad specificity phosphatase PhoE